MKIKDFLPPPGTGVDLFNFIIDMIGMIVIFATVIYITFFRR